MQKVSTVLKPGGKLFVHIFTHKDFAGIHFTGSTAVFQTIWKTIGDNIPNYRSYPRIVGETGGKDFIIAHKTANAKALATAMVRGSFEFQGQKCSAASRAYLPSNIAAEIKAKLVEQVKSMKVGSVEDFGNFVNAVIDEKSFDKIKSYIDNAKKDEQRILRAEERKVQFTQQKNIIE